MIHRHPGIDGLNDLSRRPHTSPNAKITTEHTSQLKTPLQDDICDLYDVSKEHVQKPVYYIKLAMRRLKRCPYITHETFPPGDILRG